MRLAVVSHSCQGADTALSVTWEIRSTGAGKYLAAYEPCTIVKEKFMENGHQPATKSDVLALRTELKADLQALEGRLTSDMQGLEDRLTEKWRDMQTELLKAFYSFAETNQNRLTAAEREAAALKDRLADLESRLTQVEKRLNLPPAA